nr:MAG TPA: hypothetical protein [Caudoviricetes sp.]
MNTFILVSPYLIIYLSNLIQISWLSVTPLIHNLKFEVC